ncbi:MAG TPA: SUMF1/EgtB/PvdO family nonheme iron enzyme, partial [Elusimicrobiales bacterium]|nr:SUMF1/EgtB/PvdO family nonheme iron enzyme [Elusimicrobiales bacterium]
NTILRSTVTGYGEALYVYQSSATTVYDSYIQGSTAAYVNKSSVTVMGGSVFVATNTAGSAVWLAGGSVRLALSSSTFSAGGQGAAVYLDSNNSGVINFSSNIISGGKYGFNISTQSAGAALSIASMTFQSLTQGATAINFIGGPLVATFTAVAFDSAQISVNVNAGALGNGSRVAVLRAKGQKAGPAYENDLGGYIDWGYPTLLVGPVSGAAGISRAPGLHARAPEADSAAQYQYQVDDWATMDSAAGLPRYDFEQSAAQFFSDKGSFSGQDGGIQNAGDAYLYNSTATFVFYSTGSFNLNPDQTYYWRVRVKTDENPFYGPWSSTASLATRDFAAESPVNNLDVSGVSLSGATGMAVRINFNLRENNVLAAVTPNGGSYNTADWIFVKFSTQAGAEGTWNHATLTQGGGVGVGGALIVASDRKGAFINHTASYALWEATASVVWDYAADGVSEAGALVKVFAISMVKVPTGNFVYNAGNIGGAAANNLAGDTLVNSVAVKPAGSAADWPNGYNSFYLMRYELTQGLYADFLNMLPSGAAQALYAVEAAYGHQMTNAGTYPARYAAGDRDAAKNYLSTRDAWSFLNWAALRPPTEMEFEKAARDVSPDVPDARVYPWGSAQPDTVTYHPKEGGTHTKNFMNYNGVAGGNKVLDGGRYLSGDIYRAPEQTGASPYGIADLAGNVYEQVINCGFAPVPGNGNGTTALPGSWPGEDFVEKGMRGGSFDISATYARVSDRYYAAWAGTHRSYNIGARGARTP